MKQANCFTLIWVTCDLSIEELTTIWIRACEFHQFNASLIYAYNHLCISHYVFKLHKDHKTDLMFPSVQMKAVSNC